MAKKPKKEADDGEAPVEGEAPAAGGKKKKLILFGAVGAVVLAAAGGGGYMFLAKKSPEAEAQAAAKKPVAFVDIPEMIVNLAPEPNQEKPRLLKFKVALEIGDPKTVPAIQPLLPRVEDTFQVFVRELRATDLEGSAGVYRLREELLRRVNIAVYPSKVDAVLFKEIVVQ
jgi:flagellar FliL protein